MMNRRGVTLLELLLAIALLLALGGLVLPALFNRLPERAFESSAEIVRSQLLLARAHAQATGEPIEVLFATDPPRVAARRFDASLVTLEPQAGDSDAPDGQGEPFEVTPLDDEEAPEALRIPEPWAERALADGVWIAESPGPAEGEPAGFGVEAELLAAGDEDIERDDVPRAIRLALFMPDGSAVLAEPVWVRDDHGRRGRLAVNHWTGLPSFERVTEVTPAPEREEDEQPEEEEPEEELDRLEKEFAEPEAPETGEEEETES
jgi:type II secretory pathway pseudopilin PulG